MANQYKNEVIYNGQTLINLKEDTITPEKVLYGETFHDKSGAPQQGSMITHNVYDGLDSTSTDDALSANMGKALKTAIDTLSNKLAPVSLTGLTTSGTGAASLNIPYNDYYITTPKITNIADAYCATFNSGGNYAIRVLNRIDNTPITNTSVNVQFLKIAV